MVYGSALGAQARTAKSERHPHQEGRVGCPHRRGDRAPWCKCTCLQGDNLQPLSSLQMSQAEQLCPEPWGICPKHRELLAVLN